jgi:hypothetical protein
MPDETTPGTFAFIEHKIRQSAVGTEFGAAFEWLCRFLLLNAPKYKGVFKEVWLWKDWPGRWGADKGIDLVAETIAGELWAVQAKAVRFDRSIPKSELSSFLSESNRPQFNYRLIVATTIPRVSVFTGTIVQGRLAEYAQTLRPDPENVGGSWARRLDRPCRPAPRADADHRRRHCHRQRGRRQGAAR